MAGLRSGSELELGSGRRLGTGLQSGLRLTSACGCYQGGGAHWHCGVGFTAVRIGSAVPAADSHQGMAARRRQLVAYTRPCWRPPASGLAFPAAAAASPPPAPPSAAAAVSPRSRCQLQDSPMCQSSLRQSKHSIREGPMPTQGTNLHSMIMCGPQLVMPTCVALHQAHMQCT